MSIFYKIFLSIYIMAFKNTFKKNNEYYTPEYALEPLLNIIDKNITIWEPACGEGHIVTFFNKFEFKVIGSDIKNCNDFLKYEPKEHYDIIITNPPFSLKTEFIKRCFELNKPFLFL